MRVGGGVHGQEVSIQIARAGEILRGIAITKKMNRDGARGVVVLVVVSLVVKR